MSVKTERAGRQQKAAAKGTRAARTNASSQTAGTSLVVRNPRTALMRQGRPGQAVSVFDEIGTSGLRQYGGFIQEEWAAQLQGKRGAWAYREMIDNSAVIGGILYAIEMMSRQVDWSVEGSDEKMPRGNIKATDFVESCMHDMNIPWGDVVSEILSFLPYGWGWHEEVMKFRRGEEVPTLPWAGTPETEEPPEPRAASAFDDGLIGWRKLPVRAQESLMNFEFDGYSGLRGMRQVDWHGGDHVIPVQKSLLFRTKALRGNPEGRSILRNAWQAYYFIQNIQNIEAIGIERDLAGLPVITPPENVDLYSPGNAELLATVKEMIGSVRRDENEGIILPRAGWKFELVSAAGSRQINTDDIIRRYRQEMAASILADFFLVGLDGLGSYAMVDIKSDLFGISMDAILDLICDIFNRYAIPRLLAVNGAQIKEKPRIAHSSAGRIDLQKVGQFLYQLSGAGAPIPWSKAMIAQMFSQAGLPAEFDSEDIAVRTVAANAPDNPEDGQDSPNGKRRQPPQHREEPVQKGDKAHRLEHAFTQDHRDLTIQLEQAMQGALGHLGEQASTAYLVHATKGSQANQHLVNRVMRSSDVHGWFDGRMHQILHNHQGVVDGKTQRTLRDHLGNQMIVNVAKKEPQINPTDMEPQVRKAILKAIGDGRKNNESVEQIAQRIRDYVPSGRFTKAGSEYRAQFIARNETARMQREATLAAYKSDPAVKAIQLVDGVYGPPRSDTRCMARDGEIVPIEQADSIQPYHPLCTLGFNPIT